MLCKIVLEWSVAISGNLSKVPRLTSIIETTIFIDHFVFNNTMNLPKSTRTLVKFI